MSYCRQEGKDKIIFATKEDHEVPSTVKLPEPDPQPGLILPDGSINWNCPCLGGMATGPCGVQFREAFSCFHYSTAEPKGSDCYAAFKEMRDCMVQYPALYNRDDDKDEDLDLESLSSASQMEANDEPVDLPIVSDEKSLSSASQMDESDKQLDQTLVSDEKSLSNASQTEVSDEQLEQVTLSSKKL